MTGQKLKFSNLLSLGPHFLILPPFFRPLKAEPAAAALIGRAEEFQTCFDPTQGFMTREWNYSLICHLTRTWTFFLGYDMLSLSSYPTLLAFLNFWNFLTIFFPVQYFFSELNILYCIKRFVYFRWVYAHFLCKQSLDESDLM